MGIFGTDFSADHVREFIKAKKHAEAAELAACEAARVASGPGLTACTRMPFGPSSVAT